MQAAALKFSKQGCCQAHVADVLASAAVHWYHLTDWTIVGGFPSPVAAQRLFAAGSLPPLPSQRQCCRCRTALHQAAGAQATAVTVLQVRCLGPGQLEAEVPSCNPCTRQSSGSGH